MGQNVIVEKTSNQTVELITRILWGMLGAYTITAAVFQWLSGVPMVPVLAVLVALASSGLIWIFRSSISNTFYRLDEFLTSLPRWRWAAGCLAIGIVLRVVVAAVFPSNFVSDSLTYWNLAQKLAAEGVYGSEASRSFWPPGLPFALTPFIIIFGPARWVPVTFNLLLFIGSTWCAMHLAQRTAGHCAERLVVLILAIWPNLVLLAGAPHKELLVAFLLPMAVLFYLRAVEVHTLGRQSRWSDFLGCGVCLGFAALTQPASSLFGIVFVGFEASIRAPLHRKAVRLALVGSVTILTVLPWTIRNYAVHGEFVPLNTAGGGVLYSANNPHATGGWIERHLYADSEFTQADEITQNRLGYKKAFAWISENKIQFAKLIIIKQTRFLCCDDYGAFILFNNPKLTYDSDPTLGVVTSVSSNVFWILLAFLILCGALVPSSFADLKSQPVLLLLLGVWYFLVIFSVFQSEGKHHVNVAAFIAIMASCAVPRRDIVRHISNAPKQMVEGGLK